MCGIAGVVHTDGRAVDPSALTRMAEAVAHRGPDGRGTWADGSVGLAHTRLAIIDLHGGRQPMVASDSGCVLSFNGEIYNYKALRQTLQADGATFLEHSDTEVVLRAYERWGGAFVDRLHGMFAFAIWNPQTRQLFAARDRIGIKPFYYRWLDGTLTFASELKAVLASDPTAPRALDVRSFDRYLRLQYVPAPRTIVEGIRQLPPGHTLTLSVDSATTAVSASALTSTATTAAPSSARRSTVARPMPDAPPVTSTCLPLNRSRSMAGTVGRIGPTGRAAGVPGWVAHRPTGPPAHRPTTPH